MIPLTPILLVSAAHYAVAVRARPRVKSTVHAAGEQESLGWIHRAGYWSHFDACAERSSWPMPASSTYAELSARATERGLVQLEAVEGALLLIADRPGRATSDLPNVRQRATTHVVRVGVVTRVLRQSLFLWEKEGTCDVVWLASAGNGRSMVTRNRVDFNCERGDRFVHWWDASIVQPAAVHLNETRRAA